MATSIRSWILSVIFSFGLSVQLSLASPALPAPPHWNVYDEAGVISLKTQQSLHALFQEHEAQTGEQIVIAIFKALQGEDLVGWTNEIFQYWKIGKKGKDNGVLLALYWQDRKARIEVGYGLEHKLTDALSKRTLSEYLVPELKKGNPEQAIVSASIQILTVLESPLIQNGQAQKILQQGIGKPRVAQSSQGLSPVFVIGFILLIILIRYLSSVDTHYSRQGWRRTRRSGWWGDGGGWGGGGGWGSGGGGGGFSGGGGSSGGGGASDSW